MSPRSSRSQSCSSFCPRAATTGWATCSQSSRSRRRAAARRMRTRPRRLRPPTTGAPVQRWAHRGRGGGGRRHISVERHVRGVGVGGARRGSGHAAVGRRGLFSGHGAAPLKDLGFKVTAFYLKIWLEDELAHLGECPWEEDWKYASSVAKDLEVPLEAVSLQREYWDQVVQYLIGACLSVSLAPPFLPPSLPPSLSAPLSLSLSLSFDAFPLQQHPHAPTTAHMPSHPHTHAHAHVHAPLSLSLSLSLSADESRRGRTPNPDIMCNSRIKVGMFHDFVGQVFLQQ